MNAGEALGVGLFFGGPTWLAAASLVFWLTDLHDNGKAKRRQARWDASWAREQEMKAHNTGDMADALGRLGVEFNTHIAETLIRDGWTK